MEQLSLPPQFDLNQMAIFVKVVQTGSFIGASRVLDIPKATVSRKIAQLEATLGSRLLQRTTRKVNLTEVGRIYYDRCTKILGDIEEANLTVTALQAVPSGTLRISASVIFATTVLHHWLAEFLQQYERVSTELILTNRYVDFVAEGIDVAFRATPWANSATTHKLGTIPYWVCATPRYLARAGKPTAPKDLLHYQCLSLNSATIPGGIKWVFQKGITEETICISSRIQTDDFLTLKQFVLQHNGIACLPSILVWEDLHAKRLERLLENWSLASRDIYLVYSSDRHLSPKVKAFIDFVMEKVTPQAPWVET